MTKNITKLKHRFPLRQLRKIPRFARRIWPPVFLILFSLSIAFLNYEPGTLLIGWDNLNPEFDLWMNLKRAFFGVWQEHRGLGLLSGQAHSADLPRILLLILLQVFKIPLNDLRYITTFIPLVAGPLGVYFLFYHRIFRDKLDAKTIQFASFLGALFYLFNLNTLQTFFVPFETFTWFYGVFPWLLFLIISYLEKPSIKSLSTLFFLSLLSAPAYYVETLFLVFCVFIFPFFIEYYLEHKKSFKSIYNVLISLLSFLVPQLFWLLPIAFFVFTQGHTVENAHINAISSPETYSRNLEFGNLGDIFFLKGYLFKYLDLGPGQKYDYLLSVWRDHLGTPFISLIGYLIVTAILIGIYYSLKKKFSWTTSFIVGLFLCFFFLLGGGLILNRSIPLLGELFRSPFTKFSIPLSLCFSFFFSIGCIFILDLFTFLHSRLTYILTLFSVTIVLLIFSSPMFSGRLISSNMRLAMPREYTDFFSYMKEVAPSTRVANFPQYDFWSWRYYDWGYRGSGFLWHGLKQPLLDRAFDVWDPESEKYYKEISTAIYSNDQESFEKTIDKYAINWVFLDKNVISPEEIIDLGNDTLEKFLTSSSKFSLDKSFNDRLYLYKVNLDKEINNFLSTEIRDLPAGEAGLRSEIFPFSSLSLRPNSDWIETADYLSLSNTLSITESTSLKIPSLTDSESLLPVRVDYQKLGNSLNIRLTPITPTIFADSDQINTDTNETTVSIPLPEYSGFILQIDSQYYSLQLPQEIPDTSSFFPLATVYVPSSDIFTIALFNNSGVEILPLTNSLSQTSPSQCYIEKPDRTIEMVTAPNSITLLGTDVVGCLSAPLPPIPSGTLLSYAFSYSSSTLTTANVNITDSDFSTQITSQSLEPTTTPKPVRLFSKSTGEYQQLNLLLEAESSKSLQEITYQDISVALHPLYYSTRISLDYIPSQEVGLDQLSRLQISLPITNTQFDIQQTAKFNSLLPESRNCDRFNDGKTVKMTSGEQILYQSQNAIECDALNLRHFPHSISYLISFEVENQNGLTLTTCLENHTTRRCDVFERLSDTDLTQSIIQPISNPAEGPGYTLHLFNQSIGKQISSNSLRYLSLRPIPLNFLKNISIKPDPSLRISGNPELKQPPLTEESPKVVSSHPAEFLYTAIIPTPSSDIQDLPADEAGLRSVISLYQTKSSFWKALIVSSEDLRLPSWLLVTKLFFTYQALPQLSQTGNDAWYNSWTLPAQSPVIPSDLPATAGVEESLYTNNPLHLVIIYLPQYLQFIGFAVIIITMITIPVAALIKKRQKKKSKT